jgi:type I restriction-modification system DNA methylase subunit
MALFQISVLKNYLKAQDKDVVAKAYKKFSKYFHNPSVQQNIRDAKEEQFQEGFLRELFVNVFGYTLNPNPNYDLTTELKNEKGSKKVDGAILKEGNAIGVIELKGTDTKDLEKVRQQAFDYKANQTGCVYVVTSNFEKIRFYINNAVEFEEFNLFALSEERFALLYLCLAKENVFSHTPLAIKEASIREEEIITKKFYNHYSNFKRELFRDLVKRNIKNEVFRTELNRDDTDRAKKNIKLHLFQKSQKLIDRFLFIFFAEDRGLLPPNSTLKILEQWDKLKEMDEEVPLYNRYKKYFNYLDTGRKGTDKSAEIFAYNGGLFKPDAILDSLLITNELLYTNAKNLSGYDFESQVDVNILGHIFENSLNEIESVNAEIEGDEFDKQKTKRKKDGVFYTPKYITKYIVDNTVGKLCAEKKAELNIIEEDFNPKRQKETKKKLLAILDEYRAWLLQLTILDPACGSGAFLNQALDFLIKEHQYIDVLQTALLGGSIVFPNIENTVLENNIFGVDLNEESVEIAKLSLWLRTAQPRRKLNDLNSNIKCGNSLIESKALAGDKAFNWQEGYPEIFAKGGFDVVIGNPPYGMIFEKNNKDYYKTEFDSFQGNLENYCFFTEKFIKLSKLTNGRIGLIIPITWLTIPQFENLRKIVLSNYIHSIIELPTKIFSDADLDTLIAIIQKDSVPNKSVQVVKVEGADTNSFENSFLLPSFISQKKWIQNDTFKIDLDYSEGKESILKSIKTSKIELKKLFKVSQGIVPYAREELYKSLSKEEADNIVDNRLWHSESKTNDLFKPELKGEDVTRFRVKWNGKQYVKYGEWLARARTPDYFNFPRSLIREITRGTTLNTGYTEEESYNNPGIINIISIERQDEKLILKSLTAILNSKLIYYYHLSTSPKAKLKTSIPKILIKDVEGLPIPSKEDLIGSNLHEFCDINILNTENFNLISEKFLKYLESQLSEITLTKKLQNWHELEFGEFIKELNKAIKKTGASPLTKIQEMEWMDVFDTKKTEAVSLKAEIDKTDAEIDKMVYELYGLTEEEISIVENS